MEQANRDFQMKVGREQRQKRIIIQKDCVCVCVFVCAQHTQMSHSWTHSDCYRSVQKNNLTIFFFSPNVPYIMCIFVFFKDSRLHF